MFKKKAWYNTEPMPDQNPVDDKTKTIYHTEYTEHRSQIVVLRNQLHQTYDKALLTVSTGAVVVSFTYILQSKGIEFVEYLNIMGLMWFALGSSIVLGLIGHYISCISNQFALDIADYNYDKNIGTLDIEAWNRLCHLRYKKGIYDKWIGRINLSQLILISIGIILFGFFVFSSISSCKHVKDTVIINCQKDKYMTKEDKSKSIPNIKEKHKSLLDEQAMSTHNEPRSILTDTNAPTKTIPESSTTSVSNNNTEEKPTANTPITTKK